MDRSGSFAEVIVFLDHFKSLADPRQRGKVVYGLACAGRSRRKFASRSRSGRAPVSRLWATLMERKNRYEGLDPAAVSSIRHHAKRLARGNAVPGMDIDDYEQHLALRLLRRSDGYDDRRASFATFADRVVRSKSATLARTTEARSHERAMLSFDHILPNSADKDNGTFPGLISQEGGSCVCRGPVHG